MGYYDWARGGLYHYTEDDLVAPDGRFSDLLNKGLESVPTSGSAGGGIVVFDHGTNANAIRPVVAGAVLWQGSVAPNLMVDGDLWADTSATAVPGPAVDTMPTDFSHRWEAYDLTGADGSDAAAWKNRLTTAPNFTHTGTPKLRVAGSGLKYVQYDGTAARSDAAIATQGQPYTKLVLARFRTPASSRVIIGGTSGSCNIATTSTGKLSMTNGSTLSHTLGPDTAWHIFMAESVTDGGQSTLAVDADEVRGAAGSGGQTGLRLAANGGLTTFTAVDVAAVAVFPRRLSSDDRAKIKATWASYYPGTVSVA
ncbi:hypothetical protein [Rathayibacter sp. AY1B5]|uniref:hypothetical protein n=1 Tax=Rathayibacter sp. AY1B5 TaxID=2080530 RepID=UPI0011B05A57|nr:hypothetical protein [Rathayibacter sp. AY1B5]